MLAAATSFFARTNISQNYNIGSSSSSGAGLGGSRTASPAPASSSTASLPAAAQPPPFNVGPWRVQPATHKVTNKRVSVWSTDKRSQEMERMGPASRERTIEVLKAEASALSRLRHPSILEMVEPLEETRNELIFATEPVLSSLHLSIPGSFQYTPLVELDEVEIQKGILQLCKGLSFMHTSARLIHSNVNPESIVINSAGDWKLSGLGLTIPLSRPEGGPTRWEFPTYDGRASSYTQRSFDYIAPEYALDEVLDPASDMYSLGCLIYAVHCKGNPPFKNHGSLSSLRANAGKPLTGTERLEQDLRALLNALISRQPHSRPSPNDLPLHPFFSSLPVSTLNFLDRSNFAAKTREEKISFMKGLTSVLDRFSEGLRTRKILPSLLEEMKDTHLLPYILPNIFAISQILSSSQFAALVLPSLKPLFAIKEPPQNMLTLLDNLQMLQDKTEKPVFREHVLPLVYNALDSEHAIVQERALKAVPNLCETIDYAEVQGVLFPRVALVFTKTRILSVKVATLETFLHMVKTLDQSSLTQKLVPLLSRIRTKEPAVTMATLAVQEAMGLKVDREAVATLVLPQLWAMSMGPLLTVSQFKRFMDVIKKLGDRVEKEHDQYLRDSQRIEDRSAVNGRASLSTGATGGAVDFESLVGNSGASAVTVKADSTGDGSKNWEDDVWGSIFSSTSGVTPSPAPLSPPISSQPQRTPSTFTTHQQTQSLPSSPKIQSSLNSHAARSPLGRPSPGLGVTRVSSSSFSNSAFPLNSSSPSNASSPFSTTSSMQPMQPSFPTLTPASVGSQTNSFSTITQAPSFVAPVGPNYNITLPPAQPSTSTSPPPPFFASQMSMNSVLAPSKPAQPQWPGTTGSSTKQLSKDDWGDFDPLA
ncbi:other/SCY1 protein kinase [Dichomitus squalens LYAD-421 SS1]|uniref:other/SCY1 protein kinase n=1 Tax=Dichomitus squalens (strain LYAD-421) TaxID=732165 RepID=UPI0004411BE7|nr:other/SCY1 protein kinase [Dichomitus squalens LYAD-421 SS1]EJF65710.1 other/SCY1 protein kinase [Dichomitus squalens LYAD-421 SS1]